MQNISEARSTTPEPEPTPPDRLALQRELLEEMTAWSPGDRQGAFKSWHRHALSLVHLNVLTALEAEGPLPMKRLAEAMDVSDASATGIVDRMEKRGMVERRHGTEDRRTVLVYQTAAGREVFSDMAAHRRQILARLLGELSESGDGGPPDRPQSHPRRAPAHGREDDSRAAGRGRHGRSGRAVRRALRPLMTPPVALHRTCTLPAQADGRPEPWNALPTNEELEPMTKLDDRR